MPVPDPETGLTPPAAAQLSGSAAWAQVKATFLAAVEQPESGRAAFLASACGGDDLLRAEVESLLASDAAASGFCGGPAAALWFADQAPSRRRLAEGTRLGKYEITGFVAAGGMGDVYRARDVVLGRIVALKTVRADYGDAAAQRRLVREARHAAVLRHPGICAVHEADVSEYGPYLVMEYIEGPTLHELLADRPPGLAAVLDYGMQVADALDHAHARGIVHRDLKSSNVVLDAAGRVIVLDFGLARRLPGAREGAELRSTVTQQGVLAGTPTHMAPEVLLGGEADERSDIWAFGILLHELLTGELPFRGHTAYETTSGILGGRAARLPRRIPLALRLVVERCLMKEPGARYQRSRDVYHALDAIRRRRALPIIGPLLVSVRRRTLARGVTGGVAAALFFGGAYYLPRELGGVAWSDVSALAVLPLANAAGDPAQQYYADGVTEALVAQLGTTTDVRIVAPASAARAAALSRSPAELAARLGAAAIVDGSVRRRRDSVEVELRLLRPADGRVAWTGRFAADQRNVLSLQADIVRALALEVRLAVRPGARERLATVRAVAPPVYEAYLMGLDEWRRRTQPSLHRAITHFTRAIELDPTYAPAHAALADCYNQLGTVLLGSGSPATHRPRARAAAIRALQLDPYSAEAHATLGYVLHYDWDWAGAERELRRAIELNPSYALARIWYANLLMSLDRTDEALTQVYAARDLDPFSLIVNTNVGWTLTHAGRYEEAVRELQAALHLDSTYVQAHWRLVYALLALGRREQARAHLETIVQLTDSSSTALGTIASLELEDGRPAHARRILDTLLARADTGYVPPGFLSALYRGLGDTDSAFLWLERVFEERSNAVAYMALDTAAFGGDARWRRLVSLVPPRR